MSETGVAVQDKAATAGALTVARGRLLDLGANTEQLETAERLVPGTAVALVELDDIAESFEEPGSELPSLCKSPECRDEIVARLRMVELARAREQDELRSACGEVHTAELDRDRNNGQSIPRETGSPVISRNGEMQPPIVSGLALMIRQRHPETFARWFRDWGRDIHQR